MKYIISIEGQSIELPEEVASSDETEKQALAPFFPGAATAKINRSVKDDVTTITVIKQAGTKGSDSFFNNLVELPEKLNPVIAVYNQYKDLNPISMTEEQILILGSEFETAKDEGQLQLRAVKMTFERLVESSIYPCEDLILGF